MVVLDTNILIRFLMDDDHRLALRANELFSSKQILYLPVVSLVELDFTLRKSYFVNRKEIVTIFNFLLGQKNITYGQFIPPAVNKYSSSNLSMADCLIAAEAENKGGKVATFDKELIKQSGARSYFPKHLTV